ncbi:MAG: sigma-70 family RNA polymerase sigma factor, partial [Bryobacteraceae bacterium]
LRLPHLSGHRMFRSYGKSGTEVCYYRRFAALGGAIYTAGRSIVLSGAMPELPRTDPDRLIETYRSYSHAIAAEILKKLPPAVDRDDVIGAAELGLVEAVRNFDASRSVLFKTFAYYRIRGAVYDALRKMG